MHRNMRVDDLVAEVLTRQARIRAERTGETFEAALAAVCETEAGRQLEELRDGQHGNEEAQRWQEDLARERAEERARARRGATRRRQATRKASLTASR